VCRQSDSLCVRESQESGATASMCMHMCMHMCVHKGPFSSFSSILYRTNCEQVGAAAPGHGAAGACCTALRPGARRRTRIAVTDRDTSSVAGKSQCLFVETNHDPCAQYLSAVWLSQRSRDAGGPGPYSSLMVLRRRASRSGAGRAVRGRKTRDNADSALIRLLTSNKDSGTRRGRSGSVS